VLHKEAVWEMCMYIDSYCAPTLQRSQHELGSIVDSVYMIVNKKQLLFWYEDSSYKQMIAVIADIIATKNSTIALYAYVITTILIRRITAEQIAVFQQLTDAKAPMSDIRWKALINADHMLMELGTMPQSLADLSEKPI